MPTNDYIPQPGYPNPAPPNLGSVNLPSLTTAQRDALTPANGMLIYNTTTATVQIYEAGVWAAVGSGAAGGAGYSLTASTSGATQTELLTSAGGRLALPNNTAWGFTALFTGRCNSPAASETCEFKGQVVRASGAATVVISALQENPIGDNTAGRFVCQADTTNGALQFLATGAAAQTWKWGVSVQTVEVTP